MDVVRNCFCWGYMESKRSYAERMESFYTNNPNLVISPFTSNMGLSFLAPTLFSWLIGRMDGMRVIDLGCGSGAIAQVLEDMGVIEYVGVDLASAHFAEGANRRFVKADIHDLSSITRSYGTFDCAFLLDVIEHLHSPALALGEIRRCLRPGGFLFCSTPNYFNVAGVCKQLVELSRIYPKNTWAPFGRWQKEEHETMMTSFRQRRYIKDQGFDITNHLGMDAASALLPFLYGKNDVWLRGTARRAYEAFNYYIFRKGQYMAKWCSMFSVITARVPGGVKEAK